MAVPLQGILSTSGDPDIQILDRDILHPKPGKCDIASGYVGIPTRKQTFILCHSMEVIAGVASVAGVVGILGLVGHALQGILELKKFAHSVSTASKTVKSFLEAIESLEGALAAISDFLKRAPEDWLVGAETQNFNRLASQANKCRADIEEWVKEVPVHDADFSKSTKTFFRKLGVASNEHAYSKFHQNVSLHRQGMQMSLNLLGW